MTTYRRVAEAARRWRHAVLEPLVAERYPSLVRQRDRVLAALSGMSDLQPYPSPDSRAPSAIAYRLRDAEWALRDMVRVAEGLGERAPEQWARVAEEVRAMASAVETAHTLSKL